MSFFDPDDFVSAAFNGRLKEVKDIYANNPKIINRKNGFRSWRWRGNALIAAAYRNHPDVVEYLLSVGADPSIKSWSDVDTYYVKNALEWAQEKKHDPCVALLQPVTPEEAKQETTSAETFSSSISLCDPDDFVNAAFDGDIEELKRLYASYPRVLNKKNGFWSWRWRGNALIAAAYANKPAAVEYLLSVGADPSIKSWSEDSSLVKTAFEWANEKKHQQCVELLQPVTPGGLPEPEEEPVTEVDPDDFVSAAFNGKLAEVKAMYAQSPKVLNRKDGFRSWRWRGNALIAAAYQNHPDVVAFLLSVGADANIKSRSDTDSYYVKNALEWAIEKQHDECVHVLLQAATSA